MKQCYRMFRRGRTYYCQHNITGKQESLGTKDRAQAIRLLQAKNQASEQPMLNMQLARVPLAFYQYPPVESMNFRGEIANSPNELVQIDGNIWAPFSVYRERVEAAVMTCLTTKASDWHYEEEVRYIYALHKHRDQLVFENGRCFLNIPSEAIREIIIGFRTEPHIVKEVVDLFRKGRIGKPKLLFAACHPNCYEVQAYEGSADYIEAYFASKPTNY